MAKKKATVKKKAGRKKSVTKKKKVSTKKKAKPAKKKTTPKKPAAKKAKSSAKAKTKAKAKVKKKSPAKKKATAKKKAPTRKKAAPKKTVAKKKAAPKAAKKRATPSVKKVKTTQVKPSPKRLDPHVMKIRERLLQNRGEVLKMLESSQALERDVEGLTFSNEIDLASSLEGREMVFQLSSRDRKELKLIDDALIKINEGTYGICENCGKKISTKRLQILPLTSLCIECKESMEYA